MVVDRSPTPLGSDLVLPTGGWASTPARGPLATAAAEFGDALGHPPRGHAYGEPLVELQGVL
jgi:hypothetical protein